MYILKLENKYRFLPIFILLLSMAIISPSTNASSIEQWSTGTDDFTDEEVFSYVESETGPAGGFIYVGCSSDKDFELQISTGRYIGWSVVYTDNVRYRIDKDEPQSMKMSPTREKHVYSYNQSSISTFLSHLMQGGSTILIELTSADWETSKARFSLKGSTKAVQAVLDACN